MEYNAGKFDIAVIGGGHAGVEAALAGARLGAKVVMFTLSLDQIANLPCNPSIGGTAKGHLVRELDALGGEMGKVADATFIQSRMLNRGKGPAVHSLRVQSDRVRYHTMMKNILEKQENLVIKQAEIIDIRINDDGAVSSVVTALGAVYEVKAAIIATGTYLRGKIFVGSYTAEGGPDGTHAAVALINSLRGLGLPLRRFKTGTPARVLRSSIDFTNLEEQPGDDPVTPLSFTTKHKLENKSVCHICYTNLQTHQIIKDNLHRSAMYGGGIEGIGPRYCPSIEDKVVRFAGKDRHQVFIEPMGLDTEEMYLQGLSTSLPEDVQIMLYRSIRGLENVQIMRNAYAIEYDCIDPTHLYPTLEIKSIPGLYGAGQFNGSSGYEEAAAQGLIAGVNAARKIEGKEQIVLPRSGSYIGTLIDDLVTKGCMDPYRMMTSRSEYRLILRQDNADKRLTPLGYEIGLISEERWQEYLQKQQRIEAEIGRLKKLTLPPSEKLNEILREAGTSELATGIKAAELIKRPQISYSMLAEFDPERPELDSFETEQVEIEIKYAGYIKKQMSHVEEMKRLESVPLDSDMDYRQIRGLRLEAAEKLNKIKPQNLGQAGRISGVSPADISVLMIYLEHTGGKRDDR